MIRIGNGYDVHKLVEGRKLILGGVEIPYDKGLLGHSDADVLVHAIMDLENLLMTRSEEGVSLYEEDKVTNIPTFAKEVFDVTGAGDTVISVYTLAKAAGATWEEAAKIANTAAGVVVGKIGTSTVTVDEIISFYDEIYKEWN